MSKRISALLVALLLIVGASGQFVAPGPANILVTIGAGTPVQLTTNTGLVISTLSVQMHSGGTGMGQVCIVPIGTTPAAHCGTSGQLAFELAPATSTAPGSQLSYPMPTPGLNMGMFWIDGTNSGDKATVSYYVK
jgi:hypothetical protein